MGRALVCTFLLLGITLMLVGMAESQVDIGTPRFSDLGGGPFDRVNLGNLNVHFVVPILQKAGRGLSFNYNLTYDSSIWQPVTSGSSKSWVRLTSNTWGWTSSMRGGGQVTDSQTVDQEPCVGPNGLQKTETTTTTSNFIYFDGFGTPHRFFGQALTMTGCTSLSRGFGATALDGSGYQITVAANGSVTSLKARDGSVINAVVGSNTVQDGNGNEITSATPSGTTTYTDTLGTTVLTNSGSGTPSSPITLQYTSPTGAAANYTVQYTSYTVKTNFGVSGIAEYGPTANSLVSSIQLPDGTSYSFTYEQTPGSCTPLSGTFSNCITSRIASITLATGGTVTYLYSGGPNNTGIFADGSTAGLKRILTASTTCSASTSCWQYSRTLVSGTPGTGSTWTTAVIDPNSNNTVINFAEDAANISGTTPSFNMYETQRKAYQGAVSATACSATTTNNCLLLTSFTCYNANFTNCATATVSSPITQKDAYTQLTNGSTRLSETAYNSSGLVTDDKEYDYGVTTGAVPGTSHLVKETATTYGSFNGSGCTALGNSIIGKLCQVTVKDWTSGTATTIATTSYTYDQGTLTTTSGTPQHLSVSGSRGNLTTLATQVTPTPTSLTKTFTYFDTGTPNVVTDVNGAQSSYIYGTVSCGNSFPTTINEPLGLSRLMAWNCTGGVTTQATDENSNNVTSTYNDPEFWRPASVSDQMSNQTNLSYFGQTAAESALQNFNGGSSALDGRSTLDGFGRPILAQRLQTPGGTNYDTTETDYNNIGLPQRTTMPFSATAGTTNSSAPGTIKTYDALGRVLTISYADGGQVSYTYSNNDILQQVSGTQTFKKQFEYDGLGRLASVCEMTQQAGSGTCGQSTSVNGFWTKYTYDALGRILAVTQNAQAATASQQTRSFAYDLLGRMTSETNPESGTTTYVYDTESSACGSITSPGDLVLKTDANGNITCYYHDALHRLVHESTVAGSGPNPTPERFFVYDSATVNGVAMANAKGHLAEAYTCNTCTGAHLTDEGFSYDADGRQTDLYESTPHSGGYYHTTAAYAANGTLQSLGGIPGYTTMTYGLDGEGRLSTALQGTAKIVCDSSCSGASTTYNVASQPLKITIGGFPDNDTYTYDANTARMKTYAFTVGSTPVSVQGTLTWNSNGTLASLAVTDGFNSSGTQTCNYLYDELGRIGTPPGSSSPSVSCGSVWQQTFTYDAFGNITKSGSITWNPGYNLSNRYTLAGTSYDANGNLLNDTFHTYTWDASGHPVTIDSTSCGSSGTCLTYDALGRMVEKSVGSTFTEVLYSPVGKTAIMSGQTASSAYFPLPGGSTLFESGSTGGTRHFWHKDWLGSARFSSAITNRNSIIDRAFAPFGEIYDDLGATNEIDFTGDTQDTVAKTYDTANRELNPSQGRWISPDPAGLGAASLASPQTWNRYAYVGGNPLSLVDPLGLSPRQKFCPAPGSGAPACSGLDLGSDDGFDGGGCYADGMSIDCGIAQGALSSGAAVPCPDNQCSGSINGVLVYFKAYATGSTYVPFDGPGSMFGSNNQAMIAGALYAENQSLLNNGNEQCGFTYGGDSGYSYTPSNAGTATDCSPGQAYYSMPDPGKAAGFYHSHTGAYDSAQRFSEPGDFPPGHETDISWSNGFGLPVSVATLNGNVIVYYPTPGCQTFFQGGPTGTGTSIPICP